MCGREKEGVVTSKKNRYLYMFSNREIAKEGQHPEGNSFLMP